MILSDRGQWDPIGDAPQGYAKGRLDFELHGEKLKGEKRENWLLIKGATRPRVR